MKLMLVISLIGIAIVVLKTIIQFLIHDAQQPQYTATATAATTTNEPEQIPEQKRTEHEKMKNDEVTQKRSLEETKEAMPASREVNENLADGTHEQTENNGKANKSQ